MRKEFMHSEILTNWVSVEKIRDEWDILLQQTSADSIYLRWDWIDRWGKVHKRTPKPFVVTVYDDNGNLTGIAPFYLNSMKLIGVVDYKALNTMAYYATGSEYPDIIAKKESKEQTLKAIADALVRQRKEWDCLWLPRVATWTGAVDRFKLLSRYGNFLYQDRETPFSKVDLPENIDSFYKLLSKNMRSQLKRQRNKLLKSEVLEFVQCKEKEDIAKYLDTLFKLHNMRWQRTGILGTFQKKPKEAEFYRAFARVAFEKNWLWLFGVKNRGQFVAMQIGYVYNNVFNQLQEGFDPDFGDGIGNILRIHIIDECIKSGVKEYDFLGGFTEHKRRWGAEIRKGKDVYIANTKIKNRLLLSGPIWPSGRYVNNGH